jgi:hypothetical protein
VCPFDHVVAVIIELAHIEMRVGVDQHALNLFSKKILLTTDGHG